MLLLVLALAAQPIILVVDEGGCVDGAQLAAAVVARAGDGSVVDDGSPRVVTVSWQDHGATVQLAVDGVARGQRALTGDCQALVDPLALSLALIVDPFLAPLTTTMTPAAATTAPATTTTATATVTTTVRANPRRSELRVQASVLTGVGGGLGPGFGSSSMARLQLAVGWLGIGAGARLDLPGAVFVDGAHRLESGAAALVVDGCYVARAAGVDVGACGVVEAGALRAVGIGYTQPDPTVAQVMTAGGAAFVSVPLFAGLSLTSRVGLSTPVLRARLLDGGGATVWESPATAFQWLVGLGIEP